ncbi:hypothetical protein ISF_04989 [Cordyceps fumosorosea ARSEF 2679]|uniref:Uncharacterized protein n=1 Tax=Cordyceps fumosorosea (strain ARSEF 2679) TaxID=1081104 RepID=A0A167VY73_CORFA|nr:hypothetical protein ISF_04989 [Cordyceps fumosorosea ARSEF 2679]OAA63113.1 hypothetical protein ISF_04989 [Cordyceps fumosorosea ARSEF 2679]
MEDPEPLEYPMYQPLRRTKHDGEDALAMEWPDAPILLFIYRRADAAEPEEVKELAVQELPVEGNTTVVGWFFQMDREHVRRVCTSEAPAAHAESKGNRASAVTELLLEKQLVFWQGDSKTELVSFGALDEEEMEVEEGAEDVPQQQDEEQTEEKKTEEKKTEEGKTEDEQLEEERSEEEQSEEMQIEEDQLEEEQGHEQEEEEYEVDYEEDEVQEQPEEGEIQEEQVEEHADESIMAEPVVKPVVKPGVSEPPSKPVNSERAPTIETQKYEVDEITYDSGSEGGPDDMEIDWGL